MQFNTERELQTYCLSVLKPKGINAKEEVWCNGLRADIVIDSAVIELKKTLTRDAIFQALGQGKVYQSRLKKKELWIVGQMPKDLDSFKSAIHTARELAKEGVRVSFVDRDSYWELPELKQGYSTLPSLQGLSRLLESFNFLEKSRTAFLFFFIAICLLVWETKTRNYQPTQIAPQSSNISL